eukprot:Gb_04401 [translate_table: standard]
MANTSAQFSVWMPIKMASHELLQSLSAQGVIAAAAALMLILFSSFRSKRNGRYRLPPGPNPWPIIGNLHMLGKLPHRTLQELAKKYGPVMYLRLGSMPTVVVSSPEMAKQFLKTHDAVFASRPLQLAGKYLTYDFKDVAFAPYGPYWRHMKKLCTIELLASKRIESFRSTREEEMSVIINSIWRESGRGTAPVNVTEKLTSLTTGIMCRMIFGGKFSDDDMTGRDFREFIQLLSEAAGVFNIGDYVPFLQRLDLQGVRRRVKKFNQIFDAFAEKVVDEHVESMKLNEKNEGRKDFVHVLLEMMEEMQSTEMEITRESIKALIFDMLLAGVETSATTMDWCMAELLRNPDLMKKAQKEIETVVGKDRRVKESDLPNVEYLQCLVKETLRLHPPVPLLPPHFSMESCTVGEYHLPPMTRLLVNVWAIATDPMVWEDPLAFKPERFMGTDISVKGQVFEVLPFGSGRRGCPGASLAIVVVEYAVAQLLHCFDWNLVGVDPQQLDMTEVFGVTGPRQGHLYALPTSRLPMAN